MTRTDRPSLAECAAILARVDASLRGWTPTRDTAAADAMDALETLRVFVDAKVPPPRYSELYTSPIDAADDVGIVRDELKARVGVGYRLDIVRGAAGLLRAALRDYRAPALDRSTSHADVSAHDGEAVRAARGA